MVDSRQTGERSGIILGYDNASSFATMFRRVTGQPPSFITQPEASEKGLPQHVSEKNVAFMALLCVYAVIRQIIRRPASFSGTLHLVVATSVRFIYSACNREKTGVSLCEPSYR